MKFFAVLLLALCLQAVAADSICNCRMGAVSRIVNGTATKGHIPWLVLIKHKDQPIGTGFLLDEKRVLTAASILQKRSGLLQSSIYAYTKDLSVDQRS